MQEPDQDISHSALNNIKLPTVESLKRLAISETGFVFDPASGYSFSVNETAMLILQQLQQQKDLEQILLILDSEYQAEKSQLERDLIEFIALLRKQIQGGEL